MRIISDLLHNIVRLDYSHDSHLTMKSKVEVEQYNHAQWGDAATIFFFFRPDGIALMEPQSLAVGSGQMQITDIFICPRNV